MEKRLLIVIDPQNDFTSPEGSYAQRHTGIGEIAAAKNRINKLIKLIGHSNIGIVSSRYQPGQFKHGLNICIPGTAGHALDADLAFDDSMNFFTKTEYSCFSSVAFTEYLEANNITTLLLAGFLAEYCVKQTALDALAKGYKVIIIADAIATGDDVLHRKHQTIQELTHKGAACINSNNL